MSDVEVIDDLEKEQEALDAVLGGLSDQAWSSPSAAAGWSVTDVVLHLAQTEEAVVMSVSGRADLGMWRRFGSTVDGAMAAMVEAERAPSEVVFARWRAARRDAVRALREADPGTPVPWVAGVMKPRTLATTRLAEHWAHALDITEPLGIAYPDTARLRHIAWLGHSTLPYAFRIAGLDPVPVHCVLTAPDGATWEFGDPAAGAVIRGPAAAFCRVGARRLDPAASGLQADGAPAEAALRVLRNYAA
jgi:uncharacterized protein (TIGR03084 family)